MRWLWGSKKDKNSSREEVKQETPVMESTFDIDIMPTPNPNALKFVVSSPLKNQGSSTYLCQEECGENELAKHIFEIRGIDHLHLFDNVMTVTKFGYETWDNLTDPILEKMNSLLPKHNPDYFDPDPEEERRRNLPPELKKIEEILDRTVRPGLQADGGDIQTLSLESKVLMVRYQGACGNCPSSATGTLEAIKAILRDEYDPELDVFIAPDMY